MLCTHGNTLQQTVWCNNTRDLLFFIEWLKWVRSMLHSAQCFVIKWLESIYFILFSVCSLWTLEFNNLTVTFFSLFLLYMVKNGVSTVKGKRCQTHETIIYFKLNRTRNIHTILSFWFLEYNGKISQMQIYRSKTKRMCRWRFCDFFFHANERYSFFIIFIIVKSYKILHYIYIKWRRLVAIYLFLVGLSILITF